MSRPHHTPKCEEPFGARIGSGAGCAHGSGVLCAPEDVRGLLFGARIEWCADKGPSARGPGYSRAVACIPMALLAITVLGHDRPGIIADVTAALARREVNVEDSAMTLLGGFFAWTLVVGTDAAASDIADDLSFLESDDLVVSVFAVTQQPVSSASAVPFVISVHGADRVGIVSTITAAIAEHGGNVTDLQTRLGGGLFIVVAEADFPPGTDADALRAALKETGATVGVDVSVQLAETDVL